MYELSDPTFISLSNETYKTPVTHICMKRNTYESIVLSKNVSGHAFRSSAKAVQDKCVGKWPQRLAIEVGLRPQTAWFGWTGVSGGYLWGRDEQPILDTDTRPLLAEQVRMAEVRKEDQPNGAAFQGNLLLSFSKEAVTLNFQNFRNVT